MIGIALTEPEQKLSANIAVQVDVKLLAKR